MGMSTRVIYKATKVPGIFAIAIGAAITILVQSSSITTSVLTPIVGLGVIQLEQMLPLTLGANIGTTVTGLLAALVSGKVEALQVALAHLFFNITGILIWYPIPFMRKVPLEGARALGKWTRRSRAIPGIYIIVAFFVIPLMLLGVSAIFNQGTVGFTVLGVFLVLVVVYITGRFVWFWHKQDGKQKTLDFLDKRTAMSDCKKTLPEDMQFLKSKVEQLVEHTGLPEDEEVDAVKLQPVQEDEEEPITGSEDDAIPADDAIPTDDAIPADDTNNEE